jgi:hypothetical protein
VRGTSSIAIRIGEHLSQAQAVSDVVTIDLDSIPLGTREIELELVTGSNLAVDTLTVW